MEFTSSLFVVSQSTAGFKSGISVIGDVTIENSIGEIEGIFQGDGSNLTGVAGAGIQLFVGSASFETPPIFDEWITGSGGSHDITLTASSSGENLNHYTFIENRDGEWNVVSSGSDNGLQKQDTYIAEDLSTGIYRYLVLGVTTASKSTVVKGTTVTINPGEL